MSDQEKRESERSPSHDNPYAPPLPELDTEHTRIPMRWRVIPTTLLIIFGLFGVIGASTGLMMIYQLPYEIEIDDDLSHLRIVGVLYATAGVLWIVGGFLCWKGRWRWTLAIFLLGLGTWLASNVVLDLSF